MLRLSLTTREAISSRAHYKKKFKKKFYAYLKPSLHSYNINNLKFPSFLSSINSNLAADFHFKNRSIVNARNPRSYYHVPQNRWVNTFKKITAVESPSVAAIYILYRYESGRVRTRIAGSVHNFS